MSCFLDAMLARDVAAALRGGPFLVIGGMGARERVLPNAGAAEILSGSGLDSWGLEALPRRRLAAGASATSRALHRLSTTAQSGC